MMLRLISESVGGSVCWAGPALDATEEAGSALLDATEAALAPSLSELPGCTPTCAMLWM